MSQYQVQWNYRSSLGKLDEGQIVEATEGEAEAFNRDSPGVLSPWTGEAPPQDRQVKAPKQRRDRGEGEAMSRETFKAVKA